MSGYNSQQVNVGSLVNPTEGLSRSLSDLSNMYGKQADAANSARIREQEILRREDREAVATGRYNDKLALDKKTRDTEILGNKLYMDFQEGRNLNFDLSEMPVGIQDSVNATKSKWNTSETGYREFLTNTGDPKANTSRLDTIINGDIRKENGKDASISKDQKARRKLVLNNTRRDLQSVTDPEARQKIIDDAMSGIFSERRKALDSDVSNGRFLVNRQRANAYIRRAPEFAANGGNVANLHSKILASMTGTTKTEKMAAHRAEVKTRNDTSLKAYKAERAAYKFEMDKLKKDTDYKALIGVSKERIGPIDDDDRDAIVDLMVAAGIPHGQIAYEVDRLVESHWYGTKSIPSPEDPYVIDTIASIVSDRVANGLSVNPAIKRPKKYEAETPKTFEELQLHEYATSGSGADSRIAWKPEWGTYKNKIEKTILGTAQAVGPKGNSVNRLPTVTATENAINNAEQVDSSSIPPPANTDINVLQPNVSPRAESMIVNGAFNPSAESVLNNLKLADVGYKNQSATQTVVNALGLGSTDESGEREYLRKKRSKFIDSVNKHMSGGNGDTGRNYVPSPKVLKTISDFSDKFDRAIGKVPRSERGVAARKQLVAAGVTDPYYLTAPLSDLSHKALESALIRKSRRVRKSTLPKTVIAENAKNSIIERDRILDARGKISNINSNYTNGTKSEVETMDRTNRLPTPSENVQATKRAVTVYDNMYANRPNSERPSHPSPKILHGDAAVKAVESTEGPLSALEKMIVGDEGFSADVYKDSKGILTVGVGQTKEFMDKSFKESVGVKIAKSKDLVPKFDSLPVHVKYSVLQAVYRGDAKKEHKWIKLINEGKFSEASKELLNHSEYKSLKRSGIANGITKRLEESSRILGSYGA